LYKKLEEVKDFRRRNGHLPFKSDTTVIHNRVAYIVSAILKATKIWATYPTHSKQNQPLTSKEFVFLRSEFQEAAMVFEGYNDREVLHTRTFPILEACESATEFLQVIDRFETVLVTSSNSGGALEDSTQHKSPVEKQNEGFKSAADMGKELKTLEDSQSNTEAHTPIDGRKKEKEGTKVVQLFKRVVNPMSSSS
jgi:hypothetical protein